MPKIPQQEGINDNIHCYSTVISPFAEEIRWDIIHMCLG
jgi:hypothetical protein